MQHPNPGLCLSIIDFSTNNVDIISFVNYNNTINSNHFKRAGEKDERVARMIELTNEERETTLSMVADDRGQWAVFSDDPVMIARLRRCGALEIQGRKGAVGINFTLKAEQVLIRRGKRHMTDETRAASAARLQSSKLPVSSNGGI